MAKKRVKVRWGNVAIVFVPLILLIFLLTKCGGDEEKPETSAASETTTTTAATTTLPATPTSAVKSLTIVLDPGHGGTDGGSVSPDGLRLEKTDNLRLALEVEAALKAYENVNVIMTRDSDTFPSLDDRCNIANSANADFFVSLHRNSSTDGKGVEIWVNSEAETKMDQHLAEYILDYLDQIGISQNRGVKSGYRSNSGDYYVNAHTNMPSCLVEMGFMNSEEDNSNFDTKMVQYAEAIAKAILELASDNEMYNLPTNT